MAVTVVFPARRKGRLKTKAMPGCWFSSAGSVSAMALIGCPLTELPKINPWDGGIFPTSIQEVMFNPASICARLTCPEHGRDDRRQSVFKRVEGHVLRSIQEGYGVQHLVQAPVDRSTCLYVVTDKVERTSPQAKAWVPPHQIVLLWIMRNHCGGSSCTTGPTTPSQKIGRAELTYVPGPKRNCQLYLG